MLNVGIIGFGKMGKIRALALEKCDGVKIKLVYDPSLSDINEEYTQVSNEEAIIENKDINAVFICTPNYKNMPLTIKALENNKHVFCEKPPAFNSEELEEIISVQKRFKKKLMYGFNHRHHESIIHMKELINTGDYGKVLWMRGRYGKSVDNAFFDTWRADKNLAGGGILLDQGIHMVDLFLLFGNHFDTVQSDVSNLYWKLGIEDNVFAIYKNLETGIVASLHSTMTQWRHLFSLEIFLEKGYLVLNGLKTSSETYGDEILSIAKNRTSSPAATWKDEEHLTFSVDTSWNSEVNHFISSIQKNKKIKIGNTDQALALMNLIDKTYKNGVLNE